MTGRDANGRFKPGNREGKGRPAGSRNCATLVLDKIGEKEATAVLRSLIVKAKAGDVEAARAILARCWPMRRGRLVALSLPKIDSAEDAARALAAVVDAVASGRITPEEAEAISALIDRYLTNYSYAAGSTKMEKHYDTPHLRETESSVRWRRFGVWMQVCARLVALVSLGCFVYGMVDAREAINALPKKLKGAGIPPACELALNRVNRAIKAPFWHDFCMSEVTNPRLENS